MSVDEVLKDWSREMLAAKRRADAQWEAEQDLRHARTGPEKIKVLFVHLGGEPVVREIANDIDEIERLLGSVYEIGVEVSEEIMLVYSQNTGHSVMVGTDDEGFRSLTDSDLVRAAIYWHQHRHDW